MFAHRPEWQENETLGSHMMLITPFLAVVHDRRQMHVCPSWERDPSSVALPEVSSIFFSTLKVFLVGVFPYPIRGSKDRECHMLCRL